MDKLSLKTTLIFLNILLSVNAMTKNTVIQKSNVEDLVSSGSGYSYQIRSGDPFTFKEFKGDLLEEKLEEKLEDFPPLPPSLSRYYSQPIPVKALPLTPNFLNQQNGNLHNSYGKLLSPYAKGFDNFVDPHSGYFVKNGGSNSGEFQNAAHGEQGSSAYANNDAYSKGLKVQHANEHQAREYGINGEKSSKSHDAANHFTNRHQVGQANRGGSFSNEKGHDKGSKVTGYHKVLNKDEFKKDHSFYDKADKKGFFNRYGDYDAKKIAKEGSFKKGGQQESGFKESEFGARGETDKGKFVGEQKGYNGAKGTDNFFKNYQDFAEKGEKTQSSEKGYSEEDKTENKYL